MFIERVITTHFIKCFFLPWILQRTQTHFCSVLACNTVKSILQLASANVRPKANV